MLTNVLIFLSSFRTTGHRASQRGIWRNVRSLPSKDPRRSVGCERKLPKRRICSRLKRNFRCIGCNEIDIEKNAIRVCERMIVNINECNPFDRCIGKDDVASDIKDETNLKEVCEPSGTMDKRFTICERFMLSSTAKYWTLKENIFELLVTGIEETLTEATKWNALRVQKCRFNGLDYMGEILWNSNPRRFSRSSSWLNVWDIPLFKRWMHLRTVFPKSWLWSEEEAALLLQKQVRGWLVRKREDVQEMRQFWKDFIEEKAKMKRMNGNYSKGNC